MKAIVTFLLRSAFVLAWLCGSGVAAGQEQDLIAAIKKITEEMTAADRASATAHTALQRAKESLDVTRFNSASYNARITTQQLQAAKERLDKAEPKDKAQAQELYELALELAEQRQTEFKTAEQLLPQRESEAKAVEEKYAAAKDKADKLASQFKLLVRQTEGDALARLKDSKVASEKAAFAKAAAEQKAAANAQVMKLMAELKAAEKALQQSALALKQVADTGRAQESTEVEKSIKAYAAALSAAAEQISALKAELARTQTGEVATELVAAEQAAQQASAAVQEAKKDVDNKTKATKESANRIQAAKEAVAKRTAKSRAQKDLEREEEAAKRAESARLTAEETLKAKSLVAEKAQTDFTAALKSAVKVLALSPEKESSLRAERAAINRILGDNEAQIKTEYEALARAATEAQAAADKAQAALVAADKLTTERVAMRETLSRIMRQRFYREASAAQNDLRLLETSLTTANQELQAKTAATNKVAAELKEAEQKVAATKAMLAKATAEKDAAERVVTAHRQKLDAAPIQVAEAKAAAYGGLKPLAATAWDYAKARHLLVRAGFGGTPEEVAKLHALGLHRAVAQLVNFTNQPFAAVPFAASPKERPENIEGSLTGEDLRRIRERRATKDRQQIQSMRSWWLQRMIESPRPLEEKLTLFWHGQIPVQYSDVGDSYYMYQQNQLFRDNAAGNFATLLHGVAHDAAMLKYLNNDTNVKGRANENLAREIMELFSMGRDQGYSELDIRQGARALTGYTYDPPSGQFRYVSERHDTDAKTIFGKTGAWSGDDFVKLILDTPYPPRFVARQMFAFFAYDEPSNDTVEALASVLKLNNYDLTPMLENLFLSEEFYSSRAVATQIKSPVQIVVGLHRDLGLKNADVAYLATAVRDMGQDLFEPPSVFGWQGGRTWISTSRAFGRYNALAGILDRRQRNSATAVDYVGTLLAGQKFQNHGEVVDHLLKCCLSVPLPESKRQALVEFLAPLPPPAQWEANKNAVNARLTRLLEMLICSPEYQLG